MASPGSRCFAAFTDLRKLYVRSQAYLCEQNCNLFIIPFHDHLNPDFIWIKSRGSLGGRHVPNDMDSDIYAKLHVGKTRRSRGNVGVRRDGGRLMRTVPTTKTLNLYTHFMSGLLCSCLKLLWSSWRQHTTLWLLGNHVTRDAFGGLSNWAVIGQ